MSGISVGPGIGVLRRAVIAPALFALAACADDAGDSTAPNAPGPAIATIAVGAVQQSLFAGDTTVMSAVARDANGDVIPGVRFDWTASDPGVLSVEQSGRLLARDQGSATISAGAGGITASTDVIVRLTAEDRRLAYAWVHDPSASVSYVPVSAYAYNGTGGGILVTHKATGDYVVSFERMAKTDSAFRESVLVTPYGSAGQRCNLNGWKSAPNARDLDVSVSCYGFGGAKQDARFSVLVVGSQSLPSRLAFTGAGDAAEAFAAEPSHTFTSSGRDLVVNRSAAGSFLVQMNSARDDMPENYFVTTIGGAADLCKVSSWSAGTWAGVICYAPSGVLADARFSLVMLQNGRAGKRFGFALANQPSTTLGEPYTPAMGSQRSSSGQPVRITRVGTGAYHVVFPGLSKTGTRPETVQVSPYGGGLFTCQVEGWTSSAAEASLDALVRCWNRGNGSAADTYFTILVLE